MTAVSSRKVRYSALAVVGLLAMAVSARRLAHVGMSSESLRVAMWVFTLLCPVLLGLAIGVWGGARAGHWGGRGVGITYVGVVSWAWLQDGTFPVGFHLEGFHTPLLVTLVNVAIFVMTMYFMQALGRSGGRMGARFIGSEISPRVAPVDSPEAPVGRGASMSNVQDSGRSFSI